MDGENNYKATEHVASALTGNHKSTKHSFATGKEGTFATSREAEMRRPHPRIAPTTVDDGATQEKEAKASSSSSSSSK